MKKSNVVNTLVLATLLLIGLNSSPAFGHTNPEAIQDYNPPIPQVSENMIMERLNNLNSIIDVRYTPEVGRRIKEYTVSYRIAGERLLGKTNLYFPLFNEEISKRDLPQDLKYVAVVESNLNPFAKSKSGASGLWQFITSTAKLKGLEVNDKIDERRSPEKSTSAALEYLDDLYATFGDWTLAIAAYNCGPGGIKKAMRRSGGKDYWTIRKHLPKETQKYIPRVIAAMYLMQYYHMHNLIPQELAGHMSQNLEVSHKGKLDLKELAKAIGTEHKILQNLNPQYRNKFFKSHKGELDIRIPTACYEKYLELYDYKSYKFLLQRQKDAELARLKDMTPKYVAREKILPLSPIEAVEHHRVRFKRERKIYTTSFSAV